MYVTLNESIQKCYHPISMKHIGGVIVSMLASRAVDRGFESGQTISKDYQIGICFFSIKHAALRSQRLVSS